MGCDALWSEYYQNVERPDLCFIDYFSVFYKVKNKELLKILEKH